MRLKVKSCVGSISPLLALIKFVKSLNLKRNYFTFSKEIIRKPFAPPPPSSFEAPQVCTVSLSAPLWRVISAAFHTVFIVKEGRAQTVDWVTSRGLFL